MSSSAFPSNGVPSPTAREYPFPSGLPRGKEAGNVAVFGALLWVCACVVCICLLVINGGSSNICSFSCWQMTHSYSVLALTHHKSWLLSFLAAHLVVTQWLPSFQHEQPPTLKTKKTKQNPDYCIPKQSLWKCTHTGWLEELPRSAHGLRATLKKTRENCKRKKVGCWENLMLKQCVTILGVDWNLYILGNVHYTTLRFPSRFQQLPPTSTHESQKHLLPAITIEKKKTNPKTKQIQHTHTKPRHVPAWYL